MTGQLRFQSSNLSAYKLEFGGSLLKKSNAKTARPISAKNPIHVILRSSQAKGTRSFLAPKNQRPVANIIRKQAERLQIRIYEQANVGNHIHLLIYLKSANATQARRKLNSFLRSVTGLIARVVTGFEKGSAGGTSEKFWDQRPFTRICHWRRGYQIVKDYVLQNRLEALGIIPYQPRNQRTKSPPKVSSA